MEGDVDSVMERPSSGSGASEDEVQRERDKWDAWNSQRGLSRTESKRRYIEALIETMHRYANTPYVALVDRRADERLTEVLVMRKNWSASWSSSGIKSRTTRIVHPTLLPRHRGASSDLQAALMGR
jgi:acyl-CoA-binding protein